MAEVRTLKKNRKSLYTTLSDESECTKDDNDDEPEDLVNHYIGFPVIFFGRAKGVTNYVATS